MARRKLTDQQKARIAKIQEQRRAKAQSRADDALANAEDSAALTGRVVIRHGQSVVIENDAGEQVLCLFRQNLGDVVCGDRVLWHATEDGQGVVTAVEPRDTTLLDRTTAAVRNRLPPTSRNCSWCSPPNLSRAAIYLINI